MAANRAPRGDQVCRATPDQQSGQRDDEGRHLQEGDNEALHGANPGAEDHADDDDNQPGPGNGETGQPRQYLGLANHHDHAEEADQRADRQVDVARHDDQHHAVRENRNRRRLDREVPEIARRQEKSVGKKLKPDPDHAKRDQHSHQANIDFSGLEEVVNKSRPLRLDRVGYRAGPVNHRNYRPSEMRHAPLLVTPTCLSQRCHAAGLRRRGAYWCCCFAVIYSINRKP